MRPLTLKMTAFGPYKQTETIDFTKLNENKLFVISGNTGAGKTTIFDGICFALYGSASGSDRENNMMLRSDFADNDIHTAVELSFELHGRMYRVLRQLGHIKAGNKTRTGEKYEFYEQVDGREIPCVDRQIVSEINDKIEALIGLTQDQFKQIVMLPQGEFRKLLTSETENKEAILRRLFKTENYKQINEKLREKRNILEKEYDQAKHFRDTYVMNIQASLPRRDESTLFQVLTEEFYNVNQIVSGLDEEITFYQEKIVHDQKMYDEAYKTHDKKLQDLHQSEALNKRFVELDEKEAALQKLQEQSTLFIQKEKQLHEAERASHIVIYEKQALEWQQDEKTKIATLENAQIEVKNAEDILKKAETFFKEEENKKDEREEISRKLDRLRDFLPIVKAMDDDKQEIGKMKMNAERTRSELQKVRVALTEKSEILEKQEAKISETDKAVACLPEKQEKRFNMQEQWKLLNRFKATNEKRIELLRDKQAKEAIYENLKKEYDQLEEVWINSQASILASHLHEGEACPVCGSIDHPRKAHQGQQIITREQLSHCKRNLDDVHTKLQEIIGTLTANNAQLEEVKEEIVLQRIDTLNVDATLDQLVKVGKELTSEVTHLEKSREQLDHFKKQIEVDKKYFKQLEASKEELEKVFYERQSLYERSLAVYEEKLRHIPKDVRVLVELERRIHETNEQKNKLELAWEKAQKNFQRAREEQTKAVSTVIHVEKQLEESKEKRKKAELAYQKALVKAGFDSEEAYQHAKMLEEDRLKLKRDIEQFNLHVSTLSQQVKELQTLLEGKARVDLEAIRANLTQLKEKYESGLHSLNQSKELLQESKTLKQNILKSTEQLATLEKRFTMITDLYDVLRGQNSKKISFERYLQIEYLEQIIDAANHRLKRLSNGQFLLMRSDRQESHGRQSGLALDVYDSYTGQTRDVKTLSGGEKFNASLCLALGMSDVIQSFQGNVSIETMFIDEGFGSLDEESLNKSIDTLIDLQESGRMIGVISHVQELKNIFTAVLEVTKTKEGYSKTRFVLR